MKRRTPVSALRAHQILDARYWIKEGIIFSYLSSIILVHIAQLIGPESLGKKGNSYTIKLRLICLKKQGGIGATKAKRV